MSELGRAQESPMPRAGIVPMRVLIIWITITADCEISLIMVCMVLSQDIVQGDPVTVIPWDHIGVQNHMRTHKRVQQSNISIGCRWSPCFWWKRLESVYFSLSESCRFRSLVRNIQSLSACLKGQATAFYLGLSPLDRTSYHRLVQKFTERFGSVRQQSRYLTKFETRKRKSGEVIASLGDYLTLLAQTA